MKAVRKLVIVGNGLDLHHGIRSKYKQFYDHNSFPRELRNIYDILTESFYPVERWYDFEEEYRVLVKTEIGFLERGYGSEKTGLNNENKKLFMPRVNLINYVFQRINREFVNFLRNEYEVAKDASVNCYFKKDMNVLASLEDADVIINFNYTNTLEDLYEIDREKIIHIHGTLEGDSAIIGHSNFCDYEDPKGSRYGYRINYPGLRDSTYKGDKTLQRIEAWNDIKMRNASFTNMEQSMINTLAGNYEFKIVQNNSPVSFEMLQKMYERPFDPFDDEKNGYHYCNKLAFAFEEPIEVTIIGHGLESDQDLLSKIPVQSKIVNVFHRNNKANKELKEKAEKVFKAEVSDRYYSNE